MGRGCSGAAEAGSGYVLARLGSRYPGGAWQRPPELAGVGWARLGDLGTWVAFVGSRSTARSMAPSWILSVATVPRRTGTCGFPGIGQGARPARLPAGSDADKASLQPSPSCPGLYPEFDANLSPSP